MNNQDFLDAIAVVSFIIGLANYEENLTQSDKDDMLKQIDETTNKMLAKLEGDLEEQNEMLREILEAIDGRTTD